eukprot:5533284-Lingulodinium_polyedra.AAC.1
MFVPAQRRDAILIELRQDIHDRSTRRLPHHVPSGRPRAASGRPQDSPGVVSTRFAGGHGTA